MQTRIISLLLALVVAAPAVAQPTAFTYQGRLTSGGQPASGAHDVQFRLFDAPSGGSQQGPTLCLDNVVITEGLFAATLDFGQQYATSAPRFLEIQVRADTGLDCVNASGLVVLSPRTRVTSAPLAAHANGALALDAPSGSHANAMFVDDAGRVGVGTTAPGATLDLRTTGEGARVQGPAFGNANVAVATFFDAAGTRTGYVGDATASDNALYLVSDTGDIHLSAGGEVALTVKSAGNVGIGTATPSAKLEVRGDIAVGATLFGGSFATAGEENLRIVYGKIINNGSVIIGSGFTASQTETGKYQVTFNVPFAGTPAITATIIDRGLSEAMPFLEFPGSGGVLLEVFERSSGDFVNRDVDFMAVGPR